MNIDELKRENAELKQLLKELMARGGLKGLKQEMAEAQEIFDVKNKNPKYKPKYAMEY